MRVHRPKGIDGPLPSVYSIHGGGYVLGSYDMDDAKFDLMSHMAPKDPTAGGNPVPLDEAVCRRLYENALAGKV